MDTISWRNDLWHDRETLRELIEVMDLITPEHDRKLQRLRHEILDKLESPINSENKKVLLFSAFADTAHYLYRQLAPALKEAAGVDLGLVTGKSRPNSSPRRSSPQNRCQDHRVRLPLISRRRSAGCLGCAPPRV